MGALHEIQFSGFKGSDPPETSDLAPGRQAGAKPCLTRLSPWARHEPEHGMPLNRKVRYGMVGGGPGAFIGAVHRKAAALDGEIELVAGAFSADAMKAGRPGG